MRKPIILFSILCLCILNIGQASVNAQPNNALNTVSTSKTSESLSTKNKPSVYSASAIVMDASTGTILYEKNIHEKHYPASITKVLTTLVALENSSLNEVVEFSKNAIYDVDLDSSRIGIDVGEKLTMEQSLYGIMLESANEVSYAVAEHIAGSVSDFTDLMNAKAKELGCLDSNFVNPHGLPDENHYTTAYDMALIARAAINNETFRKITGTRSYCIPPTNKQEESRWLGNHHGFIKGSYKFDGAIGGKTGYTSKAKYTLVTYAERNGMTLISVIMYCDTIPHEYSDTAALLNYGFENFSKYKITDMENNGTVLSDDLFTKYCPQFNINTSNLSISSEGYIVLPNGVSVNKAEKSIKLNPLKTFQEGENVIGSIEYTYKGTKVGSADIIYNKHDDTTPLLVNSFIPVPTKAELYNSINSSISYESSNLKKLIIVIITAVIALSITLYIVLVEIPYRKRKNAYLEKQKKRNSNYTRTDYIDF